ncbi:MAG TPA: hypothetical protein VEF76_09745 [Patescibacteria group bacterium]|nr:hypothetical protein [Patescibacteria group bacterium]
MAFEKLTGKLRDAFSYAIHQESRGDFDRKAGVAQTVIENSVPVTGADEAKLRAVLMETRTRFLDTFAEKKIAVGFDPRLQGQRLDDRDTQVEGVYYAQKDGAPIVTLNDTGKQGARHNGVLLEKLGELLKAFDPPVDLYAYTTFSIAVAPDMAFPVSVTQWGINSNDRSPAVQKNPELKTPPLKPAKPN